MIFEASKLPQVTKAKASVTFHKLGSSDFGKLLIVLINGKSAIPILFNGLEVLSSSSDKMKLFPKNFSKNSSLDDLSISLPFFSSESASESAQYFYTSRDGLKDHNEP